jgi:hypothetical protein
MVFLFNALLTGVEVVPGLGRSQNVNLDLTRSQEDIRSSRQSG